MTQEKKAKAYDKALVIARSRYSTETEESVRICLELMFPELKESEDERIWKELIRVFSNREKYVVNQSFGDINISDILAWLEKQGEHANFRNKIQIGDKVTRNEDGVLVNLSQLNRVAKKQGEQKPVENKGMNLDEEEMTPFQKKVFCIIDTTIEEEQGLKQVCDELLRLAHDEIKLKSASWSE